MVEIGFFIYDGLFWLVIGSAIICFMISFYKAIKYRDTELIPFVLFYLFSASVSTTSALTDDSWFIPLKPVLYLFYSYDILFFLWQLKKLQPQKKVISVISIIIITCIPVLLLTINHHQIIKQDWYDPIYNIIIAAFTIHLFWDVKKNKNPLLIKDLFTFWFLAAFFFFSITNFFVAPILSYLTLKRLNILSAYCYIVIYIAWIIKYFLLLKAVLCKTK